MHTIKRQDHQSRYESTFWIRSCNKVDIATVLGKNDMDTSDRKMKSILLRHGNIAKDILGFQ